MYINVKLASLLLIFLTLSQIANSQVGRNDLKPFFSNSDQKTIDKIEVTFNKGKNLENEANIINSSGTSDKEKAKNEKKYTLKRLEAAQFYQKANQDLIALFKDNVSKFWKENKNSKIDPFIKNQEDKANELSRKAKSTRNVAEDLVYPNEKLVKILEAETIEADAINIFTKVLYAYLNHPIAYNTIKEGQNKPLVTDVDSTKQAEQASEVSYIPALPSAEKDSVVPEKSMKKDSIMTKAQPKPTPATLEESKAPIAEQAPAKQEIAQKDTSSLYTIIDVKEDQVDKFNKFLEETYPNKYENYVLNFRSLNFGNFDSLRAAWIQYNQYQFSNDEIATLKKQKKDSVAFIAENQINTSKNKPEQINPAPEQQVVAQNKEVVKPAKEKANNNKGSKNSTQQKSSTTTSEKTKPKDVPVELTEITKVEKTATNEIAQGFIYRVQISACRIQVDSKSIKNIYNGGLKVIELNEDNWYKYAIGEYHTYAEARHLRDALKIPGAFVTAYLNGNRIQILNTNVSQYAANNSENIENLIYKVQIAASKKPLDKYIWHIYSGTLKVEENFEDEWYKYSIIAGSSLADAKNIVETENIPGAFITSYLGGKKIDLKDALKLSKIKKK